jgi:hypothetical protein
VKPLTLPDCDLRDFSFMPLDVVRLRDSDLAALESAEAFRAAVLLWCASWHQIPAASLPDDDRVLSNLAGFGRVVKEWLKVKEGALRGWVKCEDGRMYHPVIAEKANEAWRRKLEQAWRTEIARIKKHNQRHQDNQIAYPSFDEWLSQRTTKPCPQGQGNDVPIQSQEKPNPIERDMDMDRDMDRDMDNTVVKESGSVTQPSPIPAQTTPGLVCKALREAGMQTVNPTHPTLMALVEAGATIDEFLNVAVEQKARPDGKFSFAYVLNTVKGRREDAARLVLHQGAMPTADKLNKQEALENRNRQVAQDWKPPELEGAM